MTTRATAVMAFSCVLLAGLTATAAPGPVRGLLPAPVSYIGVGVIDVSEEAAREVGLVELHGVEVCSVAEDSPAQRSGLRVGDLVLSYRGERVHGNQHFSRLVRETPVGRDVELGIVRGRQRTEITVQTGKRPRAGSVSHFLEGFQVDIDALRDRVSSAAESAGVGGGPDRWHFGFEVPEVRFTARNTGLGADMEGVHGQLAEFFGVEAGVLVRHVRDGSPAAEAGLRAGDVIVSVDGETVQSPRDVGTLVAKAADASVSLGIVRAGAASSLELQAKHSGRSAPL